VEMSSSENLVSDNAQGILQSLNDPDWAGEDDSEEGHVRSKREGEERTPKLQ